MKLTDDAFFSHVTALRLAGIDLPHILERDHTIHVTVALQQRRPQMRGVVSHHLDRHKPAVSHTVSGLQVISPEWAWLQECHRLSDVDAVALADALMRRKAPVTSMQALKTLVDSAKNYRGIVRARLALEYAAPGTDSVPETHARLALVSAGLPQPQVNALIHDASGSFVCMPDLLFERWRVVVEYDGDVHRTNRNVWQRDASKKRQLRDLGYAVFTVTADDLYKDSHQWVAMVRRELVSRGWVPGREL